MLSLKSFIANGAFETSFVGIIAGEPVNTSLDVKGCQILEI